MEKSPETRITSYKDLRVWQKAMDLVAECSKLTKRLPSSETFGLSSQIQRAAVSVPVNIAEGHGRHHLGDYLHHLSIARGSLMEVETLLLIVIRVGHLPTKEVAQLLQQTD